MAILSLFYFLVASNPHGQTVSLKQTIQAAYTRADKAAGRLDLAGMYADCAPDYVERYEGVRIGLEARQNETKFFFQNQPRLSQATDVEKVTLHGSQATVIVDKYQHCALGYGGIGLTAPETPGTQELWIMSIWTMRDVWRKTGPHWLRVSSSPLSSQVIWNNGSGAGLQHQEQTIKNYSGSRRLN